MYHPSKRRKIEQDVDQPAGSRGFQYGRDRARSLGDSSSKMRPALPNIVLPPQQGQAFEIMQTSRQELQSLRGSSQFREETPTRVRPRHLVPVNNAVPPVAKPATTIVKVNISNGKDIVSSDIIPMNPDSNTVTVPGIGEVNVTDTSNPPTTASNTNNAQNLNFIPGAVVPPAAIQASSARTQALETQEAIANELDSVPQAPTVSATPENRGAEASQTPMGSNSQSQQVLSSPSTPLPSTPQLSMGSSSYFSSNSSPSPTPNPSTSSNTLRLNTNNGTSSELTATTSMVSSATASTSLSTLSSESSEMAFLFAQSTASQASMASMSSMSAAASSLSGFATSTRNSQSTSSGMSAAASTPNASASSAFTSHSSASAASASTASNTGHGAGAIGGSGTTGTTSSPTSSSGRGSSSSSAPPTPELAGGIVGGFAGLAIILLILLWLLRRRRARTGQRRMISPPMAQTGDPANEPQSGTMTQRSSTAPIVGTIMGRLRPASQQTARTVTTTDTAPSERGFQKISGRKLPSVLASGGDGYGDNAAPGTSTGPPASSNTQRSPGVAPGQGPFAGLAPALRPGAAPSPSQSLSGSSFYRDSQGFYGGVIQNTENPEPFSSPPSSSPATVGPLAAAVESPPDSPPSRRNEVANLRPGPARTPVINQPGQVPVREPSRPQAPSRPVRDAPPPITDFPRRQDGLGRSHPSQDGSRGSRFREDTTPP